MSDHPKEADRNLKRIYICNDVYFDVFRLLSPEKVGLELALVSGRFDALVDTQFKTRKWTIGKLRIYPKKIAKFIEDGSEKTLQFPQKPLHNSIVGFARVEICSTNSDAIAFLQCIYRLLESNICLDLYIYIELYYWDNFAIAVWPLLNVSAIIKLHFGFPSDFQNFRRFISLSILSDCSNARIITFDHGILLQFPPDDSEGSSDGQALCKWLLTPRSDGQPKVLTNIMRGPYLSMDALKTAFLNATTSVSFIIRLYTSTSVGPFELFNSLTHEQLTSRQIENKWWLIERSPTDKNEQKWAEWEKESEYWTNDWKVLATLLL